MALNSFSLKEKKKEEGEEKYGGGHLDGKGKKKTKHEEKQIAIGSPLAALPLPAGTLPMCPLVRALLAFVSGLLSLLEGGGRGQLEDAKQSCSNLGGSGQEAGLSCKIASAARSKRQRTGLVTKNLL